MRTSMIHSVHPADCRQTLWDEDDLISRLCSALDFAERTLRHLGEPRDYNDLSQTDAAVIAATAEFLLAASNVSSYTAIGPRILRVATLLEPHAHSRQMLRRICLQPVIAFEFATAHICLKRLDFYESDFDAMLDLAAASEAADGRGRSPLQMIQQEWLKQSWLYPEGMRRLRCGSHIANSALNRPIDLLHGTSEDIASFTRAILYMTDFNLFPRSLPRSRELLLREAESMLAACLDRQDYGQAAEVLLAWPLTGEVWSPAAAFAFRVVCQASRAQGFVSKRGMDAVPMQNIDPEEYRAIYAMGLLCAVSLADRRLPPAHIPQSPTRAGAFNAVLDLFDVNVKRTAWQDELAELEAGECESLSEFLLSIALHREFGRCDFSALEHVLNVGKALGLADSPIARQAAEVVGRLAQFTDNFIDFEESQSHEISICA
jgi:hypothetical protein